MPNGYGTCPTCGCPQGMQQQQGGQMMGPWQAQMGPMQCGPMWQQPMWQQPAWCGPAWGGQMIGPGMMGPGMGPGMYGGFQGGMQGQGYMGQGYAPGYAPSYYGGLPTDSEIEEMIYDAMDADPLVPFDSNIDVTVDAGTVYLKGEVPSKRVKHAVGDDAWWIPGVVDVHNEIKVAGRRRAGQEGQQAEEGQAQQAA